MPNPDRYPGAPISDSKSDMYIRQDQARGVDHESLNEQRMIKRIRSTLKKSKLNNQIGMPVLHTNENARNVGSRQEEHMYLYHVITSS